MKILILILLSIIKLFAFDLVLNTGRENNQPFAILHINNDQEFTCKSVIEDTKIHYECEILGVVNNELKDQNFALFDLRFIKEDQKIKLLIFPKVDTKVYNFSQNIFMDTEIRTDNSLKSKSLTFAFVPNIANTKEYNGLEFPIDFPHQSLPYIGALDLNSDPVFIPQSADINTFLRIEKDYQKQNYEQVITDARNAINRYKGSIFMSEFALYKLRAQNKIYTQNSDSRDQQILESMIDDAKNWMRTFTSDKNFPEVLYIMLRTYIALSQKADVDYVMSILNNEQANNYFTDLARLDYADYIYDLGDKERAISIYENTFYNNKNLDLAARSALSLSKDLITNNKIKQAIDYIDIVLKADPKYFGKDISRALDLANLFYKNQKYDTSSSIYEDTFEQMDKTDPRYENVLKNLIFSLLHTKEALKAKKYINLYMNEFVDGLYIDEIRKANDEVFLKLDDNNATLLHQRYEEIIKQYEQSDQAISNKALEEDIKLYYKEKNYPKIITYKDQIEKIKIPSTLKILEDSATFLLSEELQKDDCIRASEIFEEFKAYDIGQKISNKKKMLTCFQRTSRLDEALQYIDKNYHEDSIFYGLQKAQILFDNKQYTQVIKIADEIINSRILKSDEENFKAYYLEFLSYLRLNDYNKAMDILQILESFPMNFNMVE
ncbi:flagellar protein, partial [Campylobacter sp. TTU-622]